MRSGCNYYLLFIILIFHGAFLSSQEKVSVAVYGGASPYMFLNEDGEADGFFPHLLERILREAGYRPEFITGLTFQEAVVRVEAGEIDLIPSFIRTEEREQRFIFNASPLIVTWGQIFVPRGSGVESVFQLRGMDIGLVQDDQHGSNFLAYMEAFDIPFQPSYFGTYEDIDNALLFGRLDAGVFFSSYIHSTMDITPTHIVFSPSQVYIAANKDANPEIITEIDRIVDTLKADQNSYYYDILAEWHIADVHEVPPRWVKPFIMFLSGGVVLAGLFILLLRYRVRAGIRKLHESEEWFEVIFNAIDDAVFIFTLESSGSNTSLKLQGLNEAGCRRYGYSREEITSLSYHDFNAQPLDGDNGNPPTCLLDEFKKDIFETAHRTKTGETFPVEINCTVIEKNNINNVIVVARDITDRKKIEQEMENSHRIFNYSTDMITITGFDGYFKVVNPACEKTLGWSREELLSRPWIEFVHPDDRKKTKETEVTISGGIEVLNFENRYVCKDGSIKYFSWNAIPYRDEGVLFGIARDVTIAKRQQRALVESEERFRAFMNNAPILAYIKNETRETVFQNKNFGDFLKSTLSGGLQFFELFDDLTKRQIEWAEQKILRVDSNFEELEISCTLDGKARWFQDMKFPITVPGETNFIGGFIIDTTEIKTLQRNVMEEGYRIQKEIGSELHDGLCQQLGGISYLCESLMAECIDRCNDEGILDQLKKIKSYLVDAADLSRNLSKGLFPVLKGDDGLMLALEELSRTTQFLYKISCSFECPVPILFHDTERATHLYRIAQEAVNNAVKHAEGDRIVIQIRRNDAGLAVSVADNGKGITELDRSSRGKGLHIMRQRARMIGAELLIKNRDGGGTEVRSFVPDGIYKV